MFGNVIRAIKERLGSNSATAPSAEPDESVRGLYEEFCRTFCHRPGTNFMVFLKAEGVTRMIDWLHPRNPCAIPRGFISLAVDMTRKGQNVWEIREIVMNYESDGSRGGLPERESLDALSVLAQILDKPIKLYYREHIGGDLMVMEFHASV